MKKIVLFTFVIFITGTIFPAKIVPMDEVLKPFAISIHGDRILIREGAQIYIYSLKDFSLIKKFGKQGEGPGEFKLNRGGQLRVTIQSGNIIVSSLGRISYFDMDGKYIKERNFKLGDVYPIGKNFVGRKEFMENGKFLKRTLLELKSGKYTFHQGKLYQLVENNENEKYELHISEIERD